MFTHISLNVEIVWDDALWRLLAIWQEDDAAEPVVLEKAGRVALGTDRSPEVAVFLCGQSAMREAAGELRHQP